MHIGFASPYPEVRDIRFNLRLGFIGCPVAKRSSGETIGNVCKGQSSIPPRLDKQGAKAFTYISICMLRDAVLLRGLASSLLEECSL